MNISLIEHISKHIAIKEDELFILSKYINTRTYKKKEYILHDARVCNELYYVEKGCLRMFYINEKASEQIVQFALEGWWISDYQSFFKNTASSYLIQTIEETKIISINNEKLEELLSELPKLERYFRLIMQKELAGNQHKSKLLYEMSKEEFYRHFSNSFPEFMQRVPQYMIASYLGLTPEYMSELRKKNI